MSAKKPRAAYCTGCDKTFPKMHILINHRRTKRCGGRFLSDLDREYFDSIKLVREAELKKFREREQRAVEYYRTGRWST